MKDMGWRIRVSVLAVVAAVMFSCEKPQETPPLGKGLSLSWKNGALMVGYGTREASLTIVARLDWTLSVTSGADWLDAPSIIGGHEGSTTTVRFAFAENDGGMARTAKIRLVAAGEEDEPYECVITQTPKGVLTDINEWIYKQMLGWYYWNDAVKAATQPEAERPYDLFLQDLVTNAYAKGAYDNTENPPTIDGYLIKNQNGSVTRHFYSYISRTPAGTRSAPRGASESKATTFGFGFEIVSMFNPDGNPSGFYQLIVSWVREDSPAAEKGMKRGLWITRFNGQQIDYNQLDQFWNLAHLLDGGGTQMAITLDDDGRVGTTGDSRDVSLSAVEMTASPILHHDVLTSAGGKKVAYIFYNQFEHGDNIGTDRNPKYEFAEEMREVFKEFKTRGATELVLDLRYNPGGYVDQCRLLTSLAAEVDRSQVFLKMQRNDNINTVYPRVQNPEVLHFLDGSSVPDRLNLRKIYVLTTDDTASASEMVISSLRGVGIEVVQIGTATNGKNVGMDLLETTIDGWDYELWPITFKTLNAEDFSDYAGGFEPQYFIKELLNVLARRDELYALGDPRERLLKAALTLIDGGTVISDSDTRAPVTRADGSSMQLLPRPVDPRRGGAKYIPIQAQVPE